MYWELRCCGGKSHILTIQHRISKIAENSLVKLGIWLPYNSSLSRSMQPRQTYSPGFTNGRTDRKLRQAINLSAAMLRSGLKTWAVCIFITLKFCQQIFRKHVNWHWLVGISGNIHPALSFRTKSIVILDTRNSKFGIGTSLMYHCICQRQT